MYDNDTKEKIWICFFENQNLEVKEMLDISKSTVYKWLREEGYNRDTKKILQTINNLWNSKEYEKALELVKLYQDIPIFKRYHEYLIKELSKKIKSLILNKQWDLALKLCSIETENLIIISQRIEILIFQRKCKEALALCTEEKCNENIIILSQKITILIKQRELNKALALCTEEKCNENSIILSQKITILIKQRELNKALALCTEENCNENISILSQKITILTKQRKLNKALALCTEEKCNENIIILSQKITILIKQRKLNKALALCTEEKCNENSIILSQKITILLKLHREEEALFLCEQNKQKPMILSLYQSILQTISSVCFEKPDVTEVIIMLAHLYNNSCTVSMIENSSLNTWEKIILKIGYYERNHSKKALSILKKEIAEHQFDKKQLTILKQSLERVKKHSPYFDIAYYNHILCGKNLVVFPELEQEKTQIAQKPTTKPSKEVPSVKKEKSPKASKHYVTSTGQTVSHQTQRNALAKKQTKKEKSEENVLLLKDAYRERIYKTELRLYKYLYSENTKEQALRAWDYIEELKNRPATEENKERLLRLLIK